MCRPWESNSEKDRHGVIKYFLMILMELTFQQRVITKRFQYITVNITVGSRGWKCISQHLIYLVRVGRGSSLKALLMKWHLNGELKDEQESSRSKKTGGGRGKSVFQTQGKMPICGRACWAGGIEGIAVWLELRV